MSPFRDSWLPNLVSGLFYFLLGLLVDKQLAGRWMRNLTRYFRSRDVTIQLTGQTMHLTPASVTASVSPPNPPTDLKLF